jgi:hypothetical protein
MKRYVIIENNSGFIWGDTLADNPEHACTLINRDISGETWQCDYEEISGRFNGRSGFVVYEVVGELPDDYDGQDQEVIDLVASWPLVARVVTHMKDDE